MLTRGRLAAVSLAATVTALVATVTVFASPALADNVPATPNGQNGSTAPISSVATILLFVAIPVVVIALGALFLLPARAVGALKYRPGRPWGFEREWFGTKPDAVMGDAPTADPLFQVGGGRGNW